MSQDSSPFVQVTLDHRLRLIASALAATNFPETAQARRRHHAHSHGRATIKYMVDNGFKTHPAIQTLQGLLDQKTPSEALFTLAMQLHPTDFTLVAPPAWMPAGFDQQLKDFYHTAKLQEYWQTHSSVWENAEAQAKHVFDKINFKSFLQPFLGDVKEDLLFMPNICYPADDELGIRVGDKLIAIIPPPQAWGDSPPWPYDEDTMLTHSYRAALSQYTRILLTEYLHRHPEKLAEATEKELPVTDQFRAQHPAWEDQFVWLFISAAVAMYLQHRVNEPEYKSYLLMEKKVRGMTFLPATVSVLNRFLQERNTRYASGLMDFLPIFPAQLRVAKKIVMM
jgi:hypothetical protein